MTLRAIVFSLLLLQSCGTYTPSIMKTVDDVLTDKAICICVDRAAMQKQTDINIQVDIINKDQTSGK